MRRGEKRGEKSYHILGIWSIFNDKETIIGKIISLSFQNSTSQARPYHTFHLLLMEEIRYNVLFVMHQVIQKPKLGGHSYPKVVL